MAKYINIRTGLEVPANEVREIAPGSGIYVHIAVVQIAKLVSTPSLDRVQTSIPTAFGPLYPGGTTSVVGATTQIADAYVAVIANDATYNAVRDNPFTKAFAR